MKPKTLEEIENKNEETKTKIHNQIVTIGYHADIWKYLGWIEGLGMAKGIESCKVVMSETPEDCILVLMDNMKPKTPHEQGIKEALEWCLHEKQRS